MNMWTACFMELVINEAFTVVCAETLEKCGVTIYRHSWFLVFCYQVSHSCHKRLQHLFRKNQLMDHERMKIMGYFFCWSRCFWVLFRALTLVCATGRWSSSKNLIPKGFLLVISIPFLINCRKQVVCLWCIPILAQSLSSCVGQVNVRFQLLLAGIIMCICSCRSVIVVSYCVVFLE